MKTYRKRKRAAKHASKLGWKVLKLTKPFFGVTRCSSCKYRGSIIKTRDVYDIYTCITSAGIFFMSKDSRSKNNGFASSLDKSDPALTAAKKLLGL